MPEPAAEPTAIAAALTTAQRWVGEVPGVVMVGQGRTGDGRDCVDVWVTSAVELPGQIGGVPVRVCETPPIAAQ